MSAIVFKTPEKQTNANGEAFFICHLTEPGYEIPHDLQWEKETHQCIPVLTLQKQITELRTIILKLLMDNKSLFRNPPTIDSLNGITPHWGILIMKNNKLEWSNVNKWQINERLSDKNAIVRLVLSGIEISRSRIIPIWKLSIIQILPEKQPEGLIDFEFEKHDLDDVKSVASDDFANDESSVMKLHNPLERKGILKTQIRDLLAKASSARLSADDALDRFFDEYDLSDNESDFSDIDSDHE